MSTIGPRYYFKSRLKFHLAEAEKEFWNNAEDALFQDWEDESCGNYVGWEKEYKDCTLMVCRSNPDVPGEYSITKAPAGIHTDSDPNGEHPEWFEKTVEWCDLDMVKFYIDLFEKGL
jgi:hypothetical protein